MPLELASPDLDATGPLESDALARRFDERGFLVIAGLADAKTLGALRQAYDAILRREVDCGSDDRWLGDRIRQVEHPRH